MRYMDQNTLNALTGSRTGDGITAYVWYNGALAWPDPLPITAWTASWDITRQVQQLTMTVTDTTGRLAPWLLEDPLGAGGSMLQVTYQVGGAGTVNLGWYRIAKSVPDESWRAYTIDELGRINPDSPIPSNKRQVMVTGGASIQLTAYDMGILAANSRLLAPDSPRGTAPTIVTEVRRLMDGIAPVIFMPGVTDRLVNKTLIYQNDRLNAVQDLCKRINADYRFNGNRQLEIYPLTPQTPVWTVTGGTQGALVSVDRSQDLSGLYNIFVVRGTRPVTNADGSTGQVPIQAVQQILAGPLRVDGPHGKYPTFYESNMITNQDDANDYANVMMTTQLAGLTTDLVIVCLPHPGLQQGDWVTVIAPTTNNAQVSLTGRVKTMQLGSNGTTVAAMTLTVECSYADVQKALGGIDRG